MLLLLWLLLVSVSATDPKFNQLVDQLLEIVRSKVLDDGLDEVAIGDWSYEFSYKVWLVALHGGIGCSGGRLRSLASIYRTGDASSDIYNGTITAECPLGLRVLVFSFQRCTVSVKDVFSYSSTLSGSVGSSSIDFQVSAWPDGAHCTARLDKVELQDLSDIQITTGASLFSRLLDDVINGAVWRLRGLVFQTVQQELRKFQGLEMHFTEHCIGNFCFDRTA